MKIKSIFDDKSVPLNGPMRHGYAVNFEGMNMGSLECHQIPNASLEDLKQWHEAIGVFLRGPGVKSSIDHSHEDQQAKMSQAGMDEWVASWEGRDKLRAHPPLELRIDDWWALCDVMRSLTWGRDCAKDWWGLYNRVLNRNGIPTPSVD